MNARFAFIACFAIILTASGRALVSSAHATEKPLTVAVSIPPQADFVQRIAGDNAQVNIFVNAGQDPHHFSATPRQVMDLAKARAYFTTGMPFEEALISKIKDSHPDLLIVETIDPEELKEQADSHDHEHDAHDHGDHDGHDHADHSEHHHKHESAEDKGQPSHSNAHDHHGHHHDFDPHVWLSPPHIIQQASIIHDALVTLDPSNEAAYDENLAAFTFEVTALHHELKTLLAPHKGKAFFIYHPALTHFAEAYGLEQKSIEAEGKSPTPKQLMALVQKAKESEVKVIFTQPQIDGSSAETVADAIGGTVVSIDPLEPDVLSNLESIAQSLSASFNN
ncbi:MAG: zinc ABC transporter substrate-binding protein [Verrucomicrobiota bacterium]